MAGRSTTNDDGDRLLETTEKAGKGAGCDHPFVPDLHNGGQLCIHCERGADGHLPAGSLADPVDSPTTADPLAEAASRVPPYYLLPGLSRVDGSPADVMDLVELRWPDSDNFCEKDVLKYLLRAGSKPGVPAERDWLKIVRVAARKFRRLSGQDLPDDV